MCLTLETFLGFAQCPGFCGAACAAKANWLYLILGQSELVMSDCIAANLRGGIFALTHCAKTERNRTPLKPSSIIFSSFGIGLSCPALLRASCIGARELGVQTTETPAERKQDDVMTLQTMEDVCFLVGMQVWLLSNLSPLPLLCHLCKAYSFIILEWLAGKFHRRQKQKHHQYVSK